MEVKSSAKSSKWSATAALWCRFRVSKSSTAVASLVFNEGSTDKGSAASVVCGNHVPRQIRGRLFGLLPLNRSCGAVEGGAARFSVGTHSVSLASLSSRPSSALRTLPVPVVTGRPLGAGIQTTSSSLESSPESASGCAASALEAAVVTFTSATVMAATESFSSAAGTAAAESFSSAAGTAAASATSSAASFAAVVRAGVASTAVLVGMASAVVLAGFSTVLVRAVMAAIVATAPPFYSAPNGVLTGEVAVSLARLRRLVGSCMGCIRAGTGKLSEAGAPRRAPCQNVVAFDSTTSLLLQQREDVKQRSPWAWSFGNLVTQLVAKVA
ncbi:hypothetical protein PF004_g29083 [Phytophthora fragariae]|uniref:Uncharacterized protein n=1 Tax=Phytophthora fragariae TaxID=53985 RepID=A0A6G0MGS0_9STRA|nr:hypothetical protein PF004_g29083 [Phytophthora fragariae]